MAQGKLRALLQALDYNYYNIITCYLCCFPFNVSLLLLFNSMVPNFCLICSFRRIKIQFQYATVFNYVPILYTRNYIQMMKINPRGCFAFECHKIGFTSFKLFVCNSYHIQNINVLNIGYILS